MRTRLPFLIVVVVFFATSSAQADAWSAPGFREGASRPGADAVSGALDVRATGLLDWDELSAAAKGPTGAAAAARVLQKQALALAGTIPARGEQQVPVADLDGDAVADLLGIAQPPAQLDRFGIAAATQVTFSGRSGRTGARLWSVAVPGQHAALLPVTTDDGGMVVATTAVTGREGVAAVEMVYARLTKAGAVGWQRAFQGFVSVAGAFTLVDVPVFRGAIGGAGGRQDVLVGLLDRVGGYDDASPSTAEAEALILDARTGQDVTRAVYNDRGLVLPWPGPDADGDGRDDVVFTSAYGPRPGRAGTIALADGRDGELRWITYSAPVHVSTWLAAVGDTDGDGSGDVAVGPGFVGPQDASGVALLSGRDGTLQWQRPGDFPLTLGDVDGDGLADVGVRSFSLRPAGTVPVYAQTNAAYRGDASAIYRTEITHSLKAARETFGVDITVELVATDLDGDGIVDPRSTETVYQDGVSADVSAAFSGADGRRLFQALPGQDLGRGIDGPGNDLLRVVALPGNRAEVTARDGGSGRRLWTRQLQLDGPLVVDPDRGALYDAAAGDLNGDGTAEVVLNLRISDPLVPSGAPTTSSVVLDGRVGSTWR